MRLLHTQALTMKEFIGRSRPPYAILSHTWGDSEVSLQDFQSNDPFQAQGKGWDKIKQCCQAAAVDGFEYVWIDTCCIDKNSSAELSEAINSMFRWYQESEVCYAYLADVFSTAEPWDFPNNFKGSRWFTRGWTLQELIAPSSMIFFDGEWEELGTKNSLREYISEATGIDTEILLGKDIRTTSVAHRMSWASKRVTTRIEDEAYCLMGIFDVNMPMLYGEGERAFIRLQEEIMRNTDDHSIFAWTSSRLKIGGLLATSPSSFINSGEIVIDNDVHSQPYSITNRGIHICVPLTRTYNQHWGANTYIAILDCRHSSMPDTAIAIRLASDDYRDEQWVRYATADLEMIKSSDIKSQEISARTSIFVRQEPRKMEDNTSSNFILKSVGLEMHGLSLLDSYPAKQLADTAILFDPRKKRCALRFVILDTSIEFIIVVRTDRKNLLFNFANLKHGETLVDLFLSYDMMEAAKPDTLPVEGRKWRDSPDRQFLSLGEQIWVRAGIRKQFVEGRMATVMEVKLSDSPPFPGLEYRTID